jgi:hypothetical protein
MGQNGTLKTNHCLLNQIMLYSHPSLVNRKKGSKLYSPGEHVHSQRVSKIFSLLRILANRT